MMKTFILTRSAQGTYYTVEEIRNNDENPDIITLEDGSEYTAHPGAAITTEDLDTLISESTNAHFFLKLEA